MQDNINTFAPQSTKRNLPRDVFLHLFSIVALYWSAVSFIVLCHQLLNYLFPNPGDYQYIGYGGPIQFAMASLMIVFPVFILISWFLNKIYTKESGVRESKIRKWLIYLTLFVTALVIISDLVFVINAFLSGDELTVRFILKALSIVIVAGVVFGYYLDDVRRLDPSKLAKYFASGSIVVVLVAIMSAFFIIGSPNNASLAKRDQQRINDLQNIQYQVVNYWQRKGELPKTLADLNDSISGYINPQDPKTNEQYEYIIKDSTPLTFELCANFSLDSKLQGGKSMSTYPVYEGGISQNWVHLVGRVCFERTIDKQLYPPIDKQSIPVPVGKIR